MEHRSVSHCNITHDNHQLSIKMPIDSYRRHNNRLRHFPNNSISDSQLSQMNPIIRRNLKSNGGGTSSIPSDHDKILDEMLNLLKVYRFCHCDPFELSEKSIIFGIVIRFSVDNSESNLSIFATGVQHDGHGY